MVVTDLLLLVSISEDESIFVLASESFDLDAILNNYIDMKQYISKEMFTL